MANIFIQIISVSLIFYSVSTSKEDSAADRGKFISENVANGNFGGAIISNHKRMNEEISSCGGTFRGRQTSIESPQFPRDYPPNIRCEYVFLSPFVCKNEFHIQFLEFSLESSAQCSKDNVTIGETEILCGKVIGIMKYTAENGMLRIMLSTDGDVESKGFQLLVTRLPCLDEGESTSELPGEDLDLTISSVNGNDIETMSTEMPIEVPPSVDLLPPLSGNRTNEMQTANGYTYTPPTFNELPNTGNGYLPPAGNGYLPPPGNGYLPPAGNGYLPPPSYGTPQQPYPANPSNAPTPYNPQQPSGYPPNGYNPPGIPVSPPVFYIPSTPSFGFYPPPGNPQFVPLPFYPSHPSFPSTPTYHPNCPYPGQYPSNFPTHIQPNTFPDSATTFEQYPTKNSAEPQVITPGISPIPQPAQIPIVPPAITPSSPRCCLNYFNQHRFFLVSPGFPNRQTYNTDCLYHIEKNNPNICRVRIEFRYFLLGPHDSRFGCFDNFIEIDGRRICGCNSGLIYTSQWGFGTKIIRFVSSNTPSNGVKGFVLDIVQENCPYRLSQGNGNRPEDVEEINPNQVQSYSSFDSNAANYTFRENIKSIPNIEFGLRDARVSEKPNSRFFYPNTDGLNGGRCIFSYTQWLGLAANQFWLSKPICIRP